jgi:ABC-2 type transport system ATP-binding protein
MQEVTAVCNRLLIINHGELVADGSVDQLTQLSADSSTITIEIEGRAVLEKIQSLGGIKHIEVTHNENNKIHAHLVTESQRKLQPDISQLAHTNSWTIWHIAEERQNLEELFHSLTHE